MTEQYLMPTQKAGRDFMQRNIQGNVVMLNLLRFREYADYSETPGLAPEHPVSGEEAYRLYMEHTLPYLQKSGGDIMFMGKGGPFLIGPGSERWDAVLIIRQQSMENFIAFNSNEDYMAGMGHRIAALEDSRLLPIKEYSFLKGF